MSSVLELPVEVREMIYKHALSVDKSRYISVSPIGYTDEYGGATTIHRDIALGLLQVQDPQVDIVRIFYDQNKFSASHRTQDNWDIMYQWLRIIGKDSRNRLRNLRVHVRAPVQLVPGSRNAYLSPAISACFRILGNHGFPIQLEVRYINRNYISGLRPVVDSRWQWPLYRWDSLELPDVIFSDSSDYAGERVEVLLVGTVTRHFFDWLDANVIARNFRWFLPREHYKITWEDAVEASQYMVSLFCPKIIIFCRGSGAWNYIGSEEIAQTNMYPSVAPEPHTIFQQEYTLIHRVKVWEIRKRIPPGVDDDSDSGYWQNGLDPSQEFFFVTL